jgi:hypothetical protein
MLFESTPPLSPHHVDETMKLRALCALLAYAAAAATSARRPARRRFPCAAAATSGSWHPARCAPARARPPQRWPRPRVLGPAAPGQARKRGGAAGVERGAEVSRQHAGAHLRRQQPHVRLRAVEHLPQNDAPSRRSTAPASLEGGGRAERRPPLAAAPAPAGAPRPPSRRASAPRRLGTHHVGVRLAKHHLPHGAAQRVAVSATN